MATHPIDTSDLIATQVRLYEWLAVANGDDGAPIQVENFTHITVTIDGTFGSGGSCTLQGSNDGATWYALTDPQGNAITKTTAGMEAVAELPRFIRPAVTAGDGDTAIDVRLVCRRGAR